VSKLFASEFEEIRQRRSVGDLETLISLIEVDGKLTLVDDPSPKEIEAARKKLAGEKPKAKARPKAKAGAKK
jgi:hypothetical protein